jgi:hypothetical protein
MKIYNLTVMFSRLLNEKKGVLNMRILALFIIGVLCLSSTQLTAQQEVTKVGTTAANFLVIDVGPRAAAMGSAYVSIANDVTAMYWNPAGIARVDNVAASFSNTRWIADIAFNYAGLVVPFENFGTLGLNATFVSMDAIERTTTLSPDGTGELVEAGSYAFGVSYARNLTDRFSIGFNAKYINENIYHSTAAGFALDVGALFDTQFNGLKIGMSISNYGTKMQLGGQDFNTQTDPYPQVSGNNNTLNSSLTTDKFDLPLMFRVGVSMDVLKGLGNSNLLLSLDALHPSDDVETVNAGAEYVFNNLIALRGGYKGGFAKDTQEGFNFGGGLRYQMDGGMMFNFDYAYVDFGLLKAVHTFSVGLEL